MFDRRLINKLNEDEIHDLLGILGDLLNSYVKAYNAENQINEEYSLLLNQSREIQSILRDIRRSDEALRETVSKLTDKYMEKPIIAPNKED